jgi:hypothetical protein
MSSILADKQRPRIRAQVRGGVRGWVAGSQPMRTAVGAQINFGYLTPYLTFGMQQRATAAEC